MIEPEVRLLLATLSAKNPKNTGRAVSADVKYAKFPRLRLREPCHALCDLQMVMQKR